MTARWYFPAYAASYVDSTSRVLLTPVGPIDSHNIWIRFWGALQESRPEWTPLVAAPPRRFSDHAEENGHACSGKNVGATAELLEAFSTLGVVADDRPLLVAAGDYVIQRAGEFDAQRPCRTAILAAMPPGYNRWYLIPAFPHTPPDPPPEPTL